MAQGLLFVPVRFDYQKKACWGQEQYHIKALSFLVLFLNFANRVSVSRMSGFSFSRFQTVSPLFEISKFLSTGFLFSKLLFNTFLTI